MSDDDAGPAEVMWQGKYVCAVKRGKWEYVGRVGGVRAVVIVAEFEGKVILVDQPRIAVGSRCLELPAGLVGDEDRNATVEDTAVKELEEETGYTAGRIERLGDFHASPGMLSESFTLVRAHEVRPTGGSQEEDIVVHLVPREEIPAFVEQKRAEGYSIDVKLLIFLNF